MSLNSWKGFKEIFKAGVGDSEHKGGKHGGTEKSFWIDDKKCKNCYECDTSFTLFNRRHHCRKCGKVFCAKCASNTIPSERDGPGQGLHGGHQNQGIKIKGDGQQVRVCNYCYRLWQERPESYAQSGGKFRGFQKRMSRSHRLTASTTEETTMFSSSASPMEVIQDEHKEHSDSFEKRVRFSNNTNDRPRASSSISIDVEGADKSRSDSMVGEIAVAGSYIDKSQTSFSEEDTIRSGLGGEPSTSASCSKQMEQQLSQGGSSLGDHHHPGDPNSKEIIQSLGGSGSYSNSQIHSRSSRSSDFNNSSERVGFDVGSSLDGSSEVWRIPSKVLDLTADISENSLQVKLFKYLQELGNGFEQLASEHLRDIVNRLLEHHQVEPREEWLDIILKIVRSAACNIDRLQMPGNAPQDPRDCIKVKRVGSGDPGDSYMVKGLVFSKNIAHRRMPNDIKEPKILLLGCAVEYQRMQNRLSSLDILLEQEKEHLRLSVARILQYRPTLIFVEKTVARNAQELLLQAGVTLVLKIKNSLMNHISRLTGADIVQTIADIREDNFGKCDHFYVRSFKVSSGKGLVEGRSGSKTKTLLYLDGCPYKAGCSIILKGSSMTTLMILKKIMTFGVYAAYHHKLECKFLPLQCISAWNPALQVTSDKLLKRLRQSFKSVREKNADCEVSISPFIVNACDVKTGHSPRHSYEISDCQHFFVSLASRCPSRGLLCEAPTVHDIAFYESSDVSLVRFLLAALPEPNRHCPHPRCGDGPSKHIRAYVSGNYCVTLTVKELSEEDSLPGKESNVIWVWRQAPYEKSEDCVRVPMTLDAGQISLGLFLQYFFSAPSLKGPDGHSLNKDFACYFGIGKGIARFTCEEIKPLGVILPPIPMAYNPQIDDKWLISEGSNVVNFCEDILGRIEDMIGRVKLKMKSAAVSKQQVDSSKIKDLEEEVKQERLKLEVFVIPKSRSMINFGETSQLKVFEMNKVRKDMVVFASTCISKAIYINDQISSSAPGHSRKHSLIGGWFDNGGDVKQNGSKEASGSGSGNSNRKDSSVATAGPSPKKAIMANHQAKNATAIQDLSEREINWNKNKKSATDPIPHLATLHATPLNWSGRYTLPQGADEKVVAVYDDEPTSLIGYVLMSNQYHDRLEELKQESLHKRQGSGASASFSHKDKETPDASNSFDTAVYNIAKDLDNNSHSNDLILSEEATHIKHSFEDFARDGVSKVHFQVTVYYATQFQEIRRLFGKGDETFIHSLLRCRKWETKGGKSNAYFAKTLDDRFLGKQMSKTEISSFLTFAPAYFKYMNTKLDSSKEECCLAKIFGVYQVIIKHPSNAGGANKDIRLDLMIMENIFYAKAISRIYDLKGSIRSRYNAEPTASNAVLLDENLLETLPASPILVRQEQRAKLERALWKDTAFLAQLGVMDYSLLVGIDEVNSELVVGIIDYVRQYTWDKQLETWVKSSGILGGAGKVPTIISPKQYMKRFRIAMMVYFTLVPSNQPPEDSLDPEEM